MILVQPAPGSGATSSPAQRGKGQGDAGKTEKFVLTPALILTFSPGEKEPRPALRRREVVAATRVPAAGPGEGDKANTYVKERAEHAPAGRQRKH